MPKVSVIMAVFNGEKYLSDSIDSTLYQSFTDFEFIIVDDASTDQTASILLQLRDPRIIIHKNYINLGLAASLNIAIKLAKGVYLARQDADDLSDLHRLEQQVEFLDTHQNIDVLGCTTEFIDQDSQPLFIWRRPVENEIFQKELMVNNCFVHGSVMCRTDAIRTAHGYDPQLRTAQDYDLWLRVSETSDLACLPEVLYYYRRHSEMASIQSKDKQDENARNALMRAIERRDYYARQVLMGNKKSLPDLITSMSRRKLAQRFVWWASGARGVSKRLAAKFLLHAVLLDPTTPDILNFLSEVIHNKAQKFKQILPRGL